MDALFKIPTEAGAELRIAHEMELPASILRVHSIFTKAGHKLFVVGGAVRDTLLGLKPKDFDLATDAVPDVVEQLMSSSGIHTIATGKSFGVINVFVDADEFEIATFRSDKGSSDSRRPDSVEFTTIDKDVLRRDLTINALFFDLDTKEVVDLVGGVKDLKMGVVRTVGSAKERFSEDKLRIMRAIRFAARFGSDLHQDIKDTLSEDSSLGSTSSERIRDEFLKGIKSAKSVKHFLGLIHKFDLFKFIFKDLDISDEFLEEKDAILVISALLKGNQITSIEKKLNFSKFSIEEIRGIKFLLSMFELSCESVVRLKKLQKISSLSEAQISSFLEARVDDKLLDAFFKFELTVSGEDLMQELGLKPGKELGDAILRAEIEIFSKLLK